MHSLLPKDNLFKNIFDFTTADDWDCVAAVGHLPALHCSVDFIFLSFGIMGFICFSSSVHSLLPKDNLFKNILDAYYREYLVSVF